MKNENAIGLQGIGFVEFASPQPDKLHELFESLGFTRAMRHRDLACDYYHQNDIHFLLNRASGSFGAGFARRHGPSICSMGWRVRDAGAALELAVRKGAAPCPNGDFQVNGRAVPAIYGIGESLIYLIEPEDHPATYSRMGFQPIPGAPPREDKGFIAIDHLTNNVPQGTMNRWAEFYKNVFGFTEVRYFDIRGVKTGLHSYALRSPCGSFCIPINEGTEQASQINEYLREYQGPGIQHLALRTGDILKSLEKLEGSGIETLDIEDSYYDTIYERVPQVTEDRDAIRRRKVLVDGDERGYLLQIFTKNLVGPIFIEIIQRKNHDAFGEGNFGALFRSIERDQHRRGVL